MTTNKTATKVYNNSEFSQEQIAGFAFLGKTINNWRERNIDLYAHPTDPDKIISVGTHFSGAMKVIATECRVDWATALDYASRGKVYIRD